MKTLKRLLMTAAATLAVWALFSWPLPAHLSSGIPSTAQNTGKETVRYMVPGDHLQLLYHFRLAGDMATRRIPLFCNLYEFNSSSDADRREPGSYYFPFSLIHALLAGAGGQAFGWNMTGLVALFATLIFTWLLTRRYVPGAHAAAAVSIVCIMLPYRWVMLMGGSPTGFAMALVPIMLLGLDLAVREGKPWGGVLAGAAVLLAYCSDLHVFFFSVLALPGWCVIAFTAGRHGVRGLCSESENGRVPPPATDGSSTSHYVRMALALLPAALLVLCAYGLSRTTARELAGATMAGGWTPGQVAPYSPQPAELITWSGAPPVGSIYVGYVATILVAAGLCLLSFRAARRQPGAGRKLLVFLLLCVAIVGVVSLALGTNGPANGLPLKICRKLIPQYRMIRQPAKVFCMLPSLLSVAGAMALAALTARFPRHSPGAWKKTGASILVCVLLLAEYGLPTRCAVCLLDEKQDAYGAVADHAEQQEQTPLSVVIPLWPGNSHWSSLYLHHAASYRLRLMNGYRPAVPQDYVSDVFKRFESINQGVLSDAQLDNLLQRGCKYILIHEDAFPEKVSPFPVHLTLNRLLANPRLEFMAQDERVRAFRILPATDLSGESPAGTPAPGTAYLFPSRRWNLDTPVEDELVIETRAPTGGAPGLRWALLMRGNGRLDYTLHTDDEISQTGRVEIAAGEAWQWHNIDIGQPSRFFTPRLTLASAGGSVELGCCILNAGPKPGTVLASGGSLDIPAACFFHAGYSDAGLHSVVFLKDKDPALPILYGSLVDLPADRYRLTLQLDASAPPLARLGMLRAIGNAGVLAERNLFAGEPAAIEFEQNNQFPVRIEFCYAGSHDLQLGTFRLTAIP